MPPVAPDSPFTLSLSTLALAHPASSLLSEDLTIDNYDDSFDLPSPGAPLAPATDEFTYGGSMGTLPPPATAAPVAPELARDEVEEDDDVSLEGLGPEDLARVEGLKAERDGLRIMNAHLEQVLVGLRSAEEKVQAFEGTIATTHELLDLYVRLSSQAEHTSQLILDGRWEGVSKDIELLAAREAEAEAEAEDARQQAAVALQQSQDLAAARKRDEDARRPVPTPTPARGRGAGAGRGVPRGGSSFTSNGSSTSGIGRGGPPPATTGRGASVTGVRGVRGLRSRVLPRGAGGGTVRGRGTVE